MQCYWFLFRENGELLLKNDLGNYVLPMSEQFLRLDIQLSNCCKLPDFGGVECRGAYVAEEYFPHKEFQFIALRESYYFLPNELYAAAGVAWQILYWNNISHFCSACGSTLVPIEKGGRVCSVCKREVWPQITPAVIVLIRKVEIGEPERILLVKAHNFKGDFYGLVAGFLEVGESLEECVEREVMEETGISVKNIQYFGSQTWPYPSGIMIGFIAEYAGGDLDIQKDELQCASWYTKNSLPNLPGKLSIARKLIDYWIENI